MLRDVGVNVPIPFLSFFPRRCLYSFQVNEYLSFPISCSFSFIVRARLFVMLFFLVAPMPLTTLKGVPCPPNTALHPRPRRVSLVPSLI